MSRNRIEWTRWLQNLSVCLILACGAARGLAQVAPRPGDLELAHSRVYMLVGATGLGHEHGVEGRLSSGRLDLGAQQNAGGLVFDMNSLTAETAAARKYVGLAGETDASTRQQVNDNMRGAKVLDVANFPTAELVIDTATVQQPAQPGGPQTVVLDGRFTLHGVPRKIRIPAEAEVVNGMIHIRGSCSILQTQFGITPFTKLLGAVGVADQVKIFGDLWLYYR